MEGHQGDVLDRKHGRNLNILAMMDVSKSWRDNIMKFDDLFRNIAFDTSDGCTVATASRILQTIETRPIKLEVVIRSTFRDLIGDTKLQVMAREFVRRLGLQSGRFVYFELRSKTSHLDLYFNLPAPKLRFLLLNCAISPVLFSSSFPKLRALRANVNKVFKQPSSTLFNLSDLRLVNPHRAQKLSMESVLALFRATCQLEVLKLSGFVRFGCIPTTAEPTELSNLKYIQLMDCHPQELLPWLRFPQLCEFNFCGFDFTPDENTPPSMIGNTDFFSSLQACPLPILDQRPLTHIFVSTDEKSDKIQFTLRMTSGPGLEHKFMITAAWDKWIDWKARLRQSIEGAMKRIRLASTVCLYVFQHVDHAWGLYLPLLRLPQVSVLYTSGWFTPVAFKLLVDSCDPTCGLLLPRLKCF